MSFIAGILTFFLVVNCVVLILLVLIQLPKKDAGAGLAFGGGAADALFGAGSGNVLTKVTKWAVVVFLVLALFLGYWQDKLHNNNSTAAFEKQVEQKQQTQMPISAPQPVTPPAAQPAAAPVNNLPTVPQPAPTNTPEASTQSK
jgi:preprotein translocase subunit SecG